MPFPELGAMCGYAVTAHVETVTDANPKTEDAFVELFEAVERSEKPAVVVVQEIGGDRDRAAHCGEVRSTIFSPLGGIGLVSDCAVRDLSAVRSWAFTISPVVQSPVMRIFALCAATFRVKCLE